MLKHIYVLLISLVFIGCGTSMDNERHNVDVDTEIAIQEQIDNGEGIVQQIDVNPITLSQTQENLQKEESSTATSEVSETSGMEYTDLKGVI